MNWKFERDRPQNGFRREAGRGIAGGGGPRGAVKEGPEVRGSTEIPEDQGRGRWKQEIFGGEGIAAWKRGAAPPIIERPSQP